MAPPVQKQSSTSRTTGEWDELAAQLSDALAMDEPDTRLRAMVREWCGEARRRQLAPEAFLVAIKSQFARIPALQQRRDDGSRRNEEMERLVTMCIEEYFRSQ